MLKTIEMNGIEWNRPSRSVERNEESTAEEVAWPGLKYSPVGCRKHPSRCISEWANRNGQQRHRKNLQWQSNKRRQMGEGVMRPWPLSKYLLSLCWLWTHFVFTQTLFTQLEWAGSYSFGYHFSTAGPGETRPNQSMSLSLSQKRSSTTETTICLLN